jgi:hypothetical protein
MDKISKILFLINLFLRGINLIFFGKASIFFKYFCCLRSIWTVLSQMDFDRVLTVI